MNRFLSIFLILLFVSCELKLEDDTTYYKFNSFDYEYIPTEYNNVGDIITFVNQFNETVEFEIQSFNIRKNTGGGISFTQSYSKSYFYDELYMSLKLLNVDFSSGYCDVISFKLEKSVTGKLFSDFRIPTLNMNACSAISDIESSPFDDLVAMEINGISYSKLKIVETDNAFNLYEGSLINKVYFDFKKGIVGFDDTENNIQFRLVND